MSGRLIVAMLGLFGVPATAGAVGLFPAHLHAHYLGSGASGGSCYVTVDTDNLGDIANVEISGMHQVGDQGRTTFAVTNVPYDAQQLGLAVAPLIVSGGFNFSASGQARLRVPPYSAQWDGMASLQGSELGILVAAESVEAWSGRDSLGIRCNQLRRILGFAPPVGAVDASGQ